METHITNILGLANKYILDWYLTNGNYDPLPMLAHKYKDVKVKNFPYYGQPKLDGVRCLVKPKMIGLSLTDDPDSIESVKLISRGGQYYQIPHLQKQLSQLFIFLLEAYGHSNFILDGEIYKHGVPLQEISGAARKEVGDVLFASNSWLEYWIYDIIDLNHTTAIQTQRKELLETFKEVEFPNIKFVTTSLVRFDEDVTYLHDKYVSEGYEGLILRNPEAKYEFNQRSKGLLKVKQYQDEEFEIIGCDIDPNKTVQDSFVFVLKNNINNLEFKARPTGTAIQKLDWYRDPSLWLHKKATVRFFARSNDGLPTQGVVRDKDTEVLHIRPKGE